jgi:ethanolaminephosphotransferase
VLTCYSPNMVPKQKEMDDMVREIYSAIENEEHLANTLFVVCGDHGMNDGGNHGGSSPGETSPALVFMSPKLTKVTSDTTKTSRESPIEPKNEGEFEYYKMVEQSDIAPTLAGLLGFPIPQNNLGVFLEEFLGFFEGGDARHLTSTATGKGTATDALQILYRNANQMKKIVEAKYPGLGFDRILESEELNDACSLNAVSLVHVEEIEERSVLTCDSRNA